MLKSRAAIEKIQKQKEVWNRIYSELFGITLDWSQIAIPEYKPGYDHLIVVAKDLTIERVYDVCARQFPCKCLIDDLDGTISRNDRNPNKGAYAVWVLNQTETDKWTKLSDVELRKHGIGGIALLECILHELERWFTTKKHVDREHWLFCFGSHGPNRRIPDAYFDGKEFVVTWFYPGCGGGPFNLRSRVVIS